MQKIVLFLFLLISLLEIVFAGEVFELQPIVVTANRIPKEISKLTREVIIIEKDEIENSPVSSITELLKYVGGLDLQERSPNNVQADLSLRGSTFSQVLVLIDGIRISDPQTAHHNLDLPLSLNNIERIEILKGTAGSLYGSSAFGGVVNIITKKDGRKNISVSYGDKKSFSFSASTPLVFKNYKTNFTVDKKTSRGWRENTDYDMLNFSSNISINSKKRNPALFFGLTDKDFGASYFYSPPFDINARETTKLRFLSLLSKDEKIDSKIFLRQHSDKYIFDFKNPNKYINYHQKYSYGIDIQSKSSDFVYGMELLQETYEVDRTRGGTNIGKLGKFTDNRISTFGEYSKEIQKFNINFGIRLDHNKMWKNYISPQISLSYLYSSSLKLRAGLGSAFRAPSFTELYYEDPGNIGNKNLKVEKSRAIEIGADYNLEHSKLSATLFYRDEKDIIDWIKKNVGSKWSAENFADGRTLGSDVSFNYKKDDTSLSLNYTHLDMDFQKKYTVYSSKYKLRYPVHYVNMEINHPVGYGILQTVKGIYKKREGCGGYFLLDTNLTKKMKNYEIFIKGTNLFNKSYEEIAGAPLPGRLLTGGIKFTI